NPAFAGVYYFEDYGYPTDPDYYAPWEMDVIRQDDADLTFLENGVGGYDIDWGVWTSSSSVTPFGSTSSLYHNPHSTDFDAVRLNNVIWATVNEQDHYNSPWIGIFTYAQTVDWLVETRGGNT